MAQLIVRNIEEELVTALRQQAAKSGTSAEAEHRAILKRALDAPKKRPLIAVLKEIPKVGRDSDFRRARDKTRSAGRGK